MGAIDAVTRMIHALTAANIPYMLVPYMLVGSFSSNYYGRPRSTKDADFVAIIDDTQLARLVASLGDAFVFDQQLSFESITMTMRYVINHPATAFKMELFLLTDDAFDKSRFERRQLVRIDSIDAYLPTPEDVIIQKLRWSRGPFRTKDFDDARNVYRSQCSKLDMEYLHHWTSLHGTGALLDRLAANPSRP